VKRKRVKWGREPRGGNKYETVGSYRWWGVNNDVLKGEKGSSTEEKRKAAARFKSGKKKRTTKRSLKHVSERGGETVLGKRPLFQGPSVITKNQK